MGHGGSTMRAVLSLGVVLVVLDIAIAIGLSATSQRPQEIEREPVSELGESVDTPKPAWSEVPAERLGQEAGALYQQIRARIPKSNRVRLDHRRVGDDFEIVVELATIPGKKDQGFPSRVYCLTCPNDRCRYQLDTYRALESMAGGVPRQELQALATTLGEDASGPRLRLDFVGGASGGKVYKWREERFCDFGFVASSPRNPPAYDRYDDTMCGVGTCQVATSGQSIALEASMNIDSNAKLACLRAACLRAASTVASDVPGLDIGLTGDIAIEDGGARRGAAIIVRLRGIAAEKHRDYYERFNVSFEKAARGS